MRIDPLQSLNARQREAVTLPLGPSLVLAGPGSGKTRVLTQRLVYLVHELGVPQWNILAVTFTNKAAREMRSRVQEQMLEVAGEPGLRAGMYGSTLTVGTFHSVCARMLRIEQEHIHLDRNWVIFDTQDQTQVLKPLLSESGAPMELSDLRRSISALKNEGVLPEHESAMEARATPETLRKLYRLYQRRLQESNAMDFDDLLMYARHLLKSNSEVREKYRRKWSHVLVDEFQDTNHVQYELLRLLTKHEQSPEHLFVVGDEDQSIYAFRGADYENINRFRRDYPACRTVLLEQNYRSTPQVLAVANGVISHNLARAGKRLYTDRSEGQLPVILEASDSRREAEWISRSIQNLLENSAYGLEDTVVMYRTNAQSRELEEAFLDAGLPYRIVGALRFYDRREVKDALAYLRLVVNPADRASFMRIVNQPPRGIGRKTMDSLLDAADRWQVPIGEALRLTASDGMSDDQETVQRFHLYPHEIRSRGLKALQRFSQLLDGWRLEAFAEGMEAQPADLLRRILEECGYLHMLDQAKEDESGRKDNLDELAGIASRIAEEQAEETDESSDGPLDRFLSHVSLHAGQDELDGEDTEDKATLMTLHTAKGLEYPVVYIAGLDEETLPHSRSLEYGGAAELEEERRIFYVGLTRSQDLLFLTYPQMRLRWGRQEFCLPSRFLEEIPEDACRRDSYPQAGGMQYRYRPGRGGAADPLHPAPARGRASRYTWAATESAAKPAVEKEPRFQPAMRVTHPTFGKGMIVGSEIRNGAEEVSVIFQEHGPKKLLAELAGLQIEKRK